MDKDNDSGKPSDTKAVKRAARQRKLKSSLRDNLKKRKGQARKLGEGAGAAREFSVKLRARDIAKHEDD